MLKDVAGASDSSREVSQNTEKCKKWIAKKERLQTGLRPKW